MQAGIQSRVFLEIIIRRAEQSGKLNTAAAGMINGAIIITGRSVSRVFP